MQVAANSSATFLACVVDNIETHGLRWTVRHYARQVARGKLSRHEFRFFLARAVERAGSVQP